MQTKKVSEPTFLHQIKQCFGILFGLSAQVNMAFIFEINTNLNVDTSLYKPHGESRKRSGDASHYY
jgi:hypothetical protein